ncbi:MAG: family 4 glycosyl hydrolase [Anaerolineae bacterium]
MPAKKIVCLGAGSRYFFWALSDILVSPGLAGSEITLYDIDSDKVSLLAAEAARWAAAAGTGMRVRAAADLADAVDRADFAVSSIGGSGISGKGIAGTSYHMHDIVIPTRYGIYQIVGDTGGPAGLMMALRSIPAYLTICREMERRCPDVVFLQHSNPMAAVCRAVSKYTPINIVGICHGVQNGIRTLARLLGVEPEEVETVWIGTNHYHWFTRIRHQGRDAYPEVRRRLAEAGAPAGGSMTQKLSGIYGYQIAYPHDDHIIEFYPFLAQVRAPEEMPYGLPLRLGDVSLEEAQRSLAHEATEAERQAQRQEDLADYRTEMAAVTLPEAATSPMRGEGLGRLLTSIATGARDVYIVNVPNRGAVSNLPDHAVLELEAVTDSAGVRPVVAGTAPLALLGLLQKRIAWQEVVVDAAVTGSRQLAMQALLLDEMAIPPERAETMLDELLQASRPMLPAFFA